MNDAPTSPSSEEPRECEPDGEAAAVVVRGTPIGVRHLMAWTFGTAVVLAAYRLIPSVRAVMAESFSFQQFFHYAMALPYGIGIGSLVLFLLQPKRVLSAFPTEPGHWYIVLSLCCVLLDGGTTIGIYGWSRFRGQDFANYWCEVQTIAWGLGAVVAIVALAAVRWERPWQWPIVIMLLLSGSRSLLCMYFTGIGAKWIQPVVNRWLDSFLVLMWWYHSVVHSLGFFVFVATLLLTAIAAVDFARGRRRDWRHWVGVLLWVMMGTILMTDYVWWNWIVPWAQKSVGAPPPLY